MDGKEGEVKTFVDLDGSHEDEIIAVAKHSCMNATW